MSSAPSVLRPSRPGLIRLSVVFALLWLGLLGAAGRCPAQAVTDGTTTTYRTPIVALWREPGSFLVVQTPHGNFYYPFDTPVPARDGRGMLRLSDSGNALLKAIFQADDGMPVTLRISTAAEGMIVGLNGAQASFEQLPDAAPPPNGP